MSLCAVWLAAEEPVPRLWMATDSRLSDAGGKLLDEGSKLFELPILCREPDEAGTFTVPFYANSIGVACVGGSLVYSNVYAFVTPLLANLVGGPGTAPPSLEEVAELIGDVTTGYVRSLGHRRHDAANVNLILGGFCARHARFEAHALMLDRDEEELVRFVPEALDLAAGRAHFFGDHVDEAQEVLSSRREAADHPITLERAPIDVLRGFIASGDHATIGGELQLGYTLGARFSRVATRRPGEHGAGFREQHRHLQPRRPLCHRHAGAGDVLNALTRAGYGGCPKVLR